MTSSEPRPHAAGRVPLRGADHEGEATVFIPRWVSEVRTTLDATGFEPTVHPSPRVTAGMVFTISLVAAAVFLALAALGRANG